METNNFQRIGSESNTKVGRDFEAIAKEHFEREGVPLGSNYRIPVGVSSLKTNRQLDLGSANPPVLVECKSHRWTSGENLPSAKVTVWNEAMYYFHLAPRRYRKVLFVLRDFNQRRGMTLAEYYVSSYQHLIPRGVEILEHDEETQDVRAVPTGQ